MSGVHKLAKLVLISAGIKKTNPLPKADLYLDCRGIVNPHKIPAFQTQTGAAKSIQDWIMEQASPSVEHMTQLVLSALDAIPYRRLDELKPFDRPVVVCFFCAYGQHRSVAVKHIVGKRLADAGLDVKVEGI